MIEVERRKKMLDIGLSQTDIARAMSEQFGINFTSATVTVSRMISGADWFPVYATWLEKEYGIICHRPDWLKPKSERLRQARDDMKYATNTNVFDQLEEINSELFNKFNAAMDQAETLLAVVKIQNAALRRILEIPVDQHTNWDVRQIAIDAVLASVNTIKGEVENVNETLD